MTPALSCVDCGRTDDLVAFPDDDGNPYVMCGACMEATLDEEGSWLLELMSERGFVRLYTDRSIPQFPSRRDDASRADLQRFSERSYVMEPMHQRRA